jgi:hypothetical protein
MLAHIRIPVGGRERGARRLHAAVTVTMLKALLALADASPARERGLVLAEVKSVLAHYLDQIGTP